MILYLANSVHMIYNLLSWVSHCLHWCYQLTIIGCFGQGINEGVSIQRFKFSLPSEVMYYPWKLLKLPHKSARHSVLCNLWSSIATLFSTHVLLWRWNNDITALSTRQFCFGSNCHPKAQRFDLYWVFQRYKHSLHSCPGFGMALLGCWHGVDVSVYWNIDSNLCIACVSPIRKQHEAKLSMHGLIAIVWSRQSCYAMLCLWSPSNCCWGNCKNTDMLYKQRAFSAALPNHCKLFKL